MPLSSLKLPTSVEPRANKILMFDCLILFGEELGSYYDLKMKPILGDNWLRLIGQERGEYNLTLHDPDFVIKEPLRSDSKLRSILPKNKSFYDNLDILRKIRNYIAHNKTEGGYEQTREVLQILFQVSMDIGLTNCTNQFAFAIKRVEALNDGQNFTRDPHTTNRVEDLERKSAELEEQLFDERVRLADLSKKLEEANSVVVIKEFELQEQGENTINQTASVERLTLELDRAQVEAQELRTQLETNLQKAEDIKKSEVNLKKLIASLAETISNPLSARVSKTSNPEDKIIGKGDSTIRESQSVQEIGSPWELPKGSRKLVLSVSARDLVDKSGSILSGVDPARTKALAEKWLKIRPQGGRIFIDENGHASTLIDDQLIYLGNVNSSLF